MAHRMFQNFIIIMMLFSSVCLFTQTHSSPASTGPERPVALLYIGGVDLSFVGNDDVDGSVSIRLSIDTSSSLSLRQAYFGIGFQNRDFSENRTDMVGPNGTDFVIFRGAQDGDVVIEHRRLRRGALNKEPEKLRYYEVGMNQSAVSGGNSDRFWAFSFETNDSRHIYTAKMTCLPGKEGLADLSKPLGVIFARGPTFNGTIRQHRVGVTHRGFNRTRVTLGDYRTRRVNLFVPCGPGPRLRQPFPCLSPNPPATCMTNGVTTVNGTNATNGTDGANLGLTPDPYSAGSHTVAPKIVILLLSFAILPFVVGFVLSQP